MDKVVHKVASPLRGFWYFLRCKARGMPVSVNLEITKRCNARCSFCGCWKAGESEELADYADIIRKFRPVLVSISGGEPFMRRDCADIIRGIRPYCHYIAFITNGAMLDEGRARALVDAGVDQICVSLDYLGERHDEARKVKGLYAHLAKTIPALTAAGYRIALNTIIMESNLDQILPIAYRAKEWGAMVSYSAYCALKRDDEGGMVAQDRYTQLMGIVGEVRTLKRKLGHIKNSDYYLERVPVYFRDGSVHGCLAGLRWIQVTPDGYVQKCSELPRVCHYADYVPRRQKKVSCDKCWYTCRGEAEANPLAPGRLMELIRA
ncbi:MAG: radical SAM protein [Proteobacteria bacterium]|nr:radical SAM protein [Pseudomonadota bacterium]